jgi:hypothetical protein
MSATRKCCLVVLAILIVLGVVFAHLLSSERNIQIVGTIRKDDLAEIMTVVRHATTNRILGPPGHEDFRKLPTLMKYSSSHPVVRIEAQKNGTVEVLFRETEFRGDAGYVLRKEPSGWKVEATLFR